MKIPFYKYHGTGNDFVLIDNRDQKIQLTQKEIEHICHRRFGIGADGLMLLQLTHDADFLMKYYNSDGNESSMCGNGGRCIVKFAQDLGVIQQSARFIAVDGLHTATIDDGEVELSMSDVNGITKIGEDFELNTGSPHYVQYRLDAQEMDVVQDGRKIRMSEAYAKQGINVNFIKEIATKTLFVATYERGVEDETLSCGTGMVASALVHVRNQIGTHYIRIRTKGGMVLVKCKNMGNDYFTEVMLCGPAKFVYNGTIEI